MEALNPLVVFCRDNESLKGISEDGLQRRRPGKLLMV